MAPKPPKPLSREVRRLRLRGRIWRWASTAHVWIGVIVGAQAILWLASGFVMTWLDLDTVHGNHLIDRQRQPLAAAAPLQPAQLQTPPALLDAAASLKAETLTLARLGERLVWRARGPKGTAMFDAETGQRLDPLPEDAVRALAVAAYRGEGTLGGVALLTQEPGDYRRALPVWQVRFLDADNTRFYVSPQTGEILSVTTDIWRTFDWFWMVHIMDYKNRSNINLPLVRAASLLGLGLGLSGLVLLGLRLTRRRG